MVILDTTSIDYEYLSNIEQNQTPVLNHDEILTSAGILNDSPSGMS